VSSDREEVQSRINAIESSYEFFLAYAAQGLTTDQGAKAGVELRSFLERMEKSLDGLAGLVASLTEGVEPTDAWSRMIEVVDADSSAALAAVQLVSVRPAVSSRLIDNLNANVHLRALLTDLFLVDELVDEPWD
jgi:hypothetical protein